MFVVYCAVMCLTQSYEVSHIHLRERTWIRMILESNRNFHILSGALLEIIQTSDPDLALTADVTHLARAGCVTVMHCAA